MYHANRVTINRLLYCKQYIRSKWKTVELFPQHDCPLDYWRIAIICGVYHIYVARLNLCGVAELKHRNIVDGLLTIPPTEDEERAPNRDARVAIPVLCHSERMELLIIDSRGCKSHCQAVRFMCTHHKREPPATPEQRWWAQPSCTAKASSHVFRFALAPQKRKATSNSLLRGHAVRCERHCSSTLVAFVPLETPQTPTAKQERRLSLFIRGKSVIATRGHLHACCESDLCFVVRHVL